MATSLSVCPLCKSDLNPGAIACKSCGAAEIDGWDAMGAAKRLPYILLALSILFSPMVFLFSPLFGLMVLIAGIGGFFYIRQSSKKRRVWVNSASRKQVY